VTCTATDAGGNMAVCQFPVIVVRGTRPPERGHRPADAPSPARSAPGRPLDCPSSSGASCVFAPATRLAGGGQATDRRGGIERSNRARGLDDVRERGPEPVRRAHPQLSHLERARAAGCSVEPRKEDLLADHHRPGVGKCASLRTVSR
jgi:hypothetical protein